MTTFVDQPIVQGVYNSSPPTPTSGSSVQLQTDSSGNLKSVVENAVAAGTAGTPSTNVISIQGITSMTPVQSQPAVGTAGGATTYALIAPATPAAVNVQSGAGKVWSLIAINIGSSLAYLKVFDVGSAPTLGTTAATWNIPIPANTSGAGVALSFPVGRKVTNNLYVAVTGGIATTDDTSITANTVVLDITYSA
jgi:hypothetical protein